jgi:hypothetical protein
MKKLILKRNSRWCKNVCVRVWALRVFIPTDPSLSTWHIYNRQELKVEILTECERVGGTVKEGHVYITEDEEVKVPSPLFPILYHPSPIPSYHWVHCRDMCLSANSFYCIADFCLI